MGGWGVVRLHVGPSRTGCDTVSAVDEIRAAIEKLTELKVEGTIGPWLVEEVPETGECCLIREFKFFGPQTAPLLEFVAPGGMSRADSDLIVTLHRTIDAQLAILNGALGDAEGSHDEPAAFDSAVALARTINGADRTVTP